MAQLVNISHKKLAVYLVGSIALFLISLGLTIAYAPGIAEANQRDMDAARATYPNITGTALDSCSLCPIVSFDKNSYGQAYEEAEENSSAIEKLDSDGDEFSNIEEILALTFPGDPGSKPSQLPPAGSVIVAVEGPTRVNVGQEFEVSVVAYDVEEAKAVYGAQFELDFDAGKLQVTPASLQPASQMNPYLVANSQVDNGNGQVTLAYSRQGDVTGLSGEVTLATVRFRAIAATAFNKVGAVDSVVIDLYFNNDDGNDDDNDDESEDNGGDGTTISLLPRLDSFMGRDKQLADNAKLSAVNEEGFQPRSNHYPLILGTKDADVISISQVGPLQVVISDGELSDKASVSGQVNLANGLSGTGAVVEIAGTSWSATADSSDSFTIFDVTPGIYRIEADAPLHLRAFCDNKQISVPTTLLTSVTLLGGDLNDDNVIDISDATAIGVYFGTDSSSADINRDGIVNVLDLIILAKNYQVSSPAWGC